LTISLRSNGSPVSESTGLSEIRLPVLGLSWFKLDALNLRRGWDKPNGTGHQRQAQMAIPAWAHGMPPQSERGLNGQPPLRLRQGIAITIERAMQLEKIK
jgi:hypothetical protein